ncbi:hypothetical protein PC117_g16166 [Phytophthora cactorum]|uniref:Uncharacterized protein n=1 Tax=Phytophthora cactorum TaxID=29920 RepID=A0A8T1CHT6_9STRA|nr:hypothetical protein PC117_g16166 [Phytophthora cactorum]
MGIAFLLEHTKKTGDLADSILALKTLIETLDIATKEAQKPQIGEEANSFQTLKDRWSSVTLKQRAGVAPLLCKSREIGLIYANAGDKNAKTSVLYNIGSESKSGDSGDADDDESKSEDESMADSSDDFSPSSKIMQDDFNAFLYDGSEAKKEST